MKELLNNKDDEESSFHSLNSILKSSSDSCENLKTMGRMSVDEEEKKKKKKNRNEPEIP